MKGIAHFVTGVTAASFFPWSIEAALAGNPLYFVLGGAFGLLPDTLDFKFYRFFYRHDLTLDPDPLHPDPQGMAEALAGAVAQARREGRTVRAKLNTISLGADAWQQYTVRFDADAGEVRVRFGPAVNTGQVPIPGTQPDRPPEGRAALEGPLVQTYDAETTVDIFDGPSFAFEPEADGRVVLHFLPWHRTWSHSLTLAAGAALAAWPLFGWRAALVMIAGFLGHVAEDQLGYMGSSLLFPFARTRFKGLHAMRSGDAAPNFLVVWICGLLVFWNLWRRAPAPPDIGFLRYALVGMLPVALFGLAHYALARRRATDPADAPGEWSDPMAE